MARRGSLVGDAYVRIHADSSAIDRELRRDFNKRAKEVGTEAGKKNSEAYFDSWDAESKRRVKGRKEELIRGIVGGKKDWDRQFKASGLASVDEFARKARSAIKGFAGDVGDITPANLKRLQAALNNLDKWAKEAKVQQRLERIAKSIKDQDAAFRSYAQNIKFSEAETNKFEKVILDQDRAWQSYADNIDESRVAVIKMRKAVKDQDAAFRSYTENIREGNRIQKDWERAVQRIHKAVLDQDRAFATYSDNVGKKLPNAFRRLAARLNNDVSLKRYADRTGTLIPRALLRLNQHLDASEHKIGRFATILGKAFGKGSRNNFFNFVGSVVEGVGRVGTALVHGIAHFATFGAVFAHIFGSGLLNVFKGFGSLFTGGGFGDIGKAIKGIGSGLADLAIEIGVTLAGAMKAIIPLAIAVAAAMTLISVVVFPLIALIANLAGAVVALAAEISVALAGGLLAFAPVLLAVAGGIGFIVFAITKLNKATGAAKRALKPFTDAWGKFLKSFEGKPLTDFAKALGGFAAPIKNFLIPLTKRFGVVVTEVTDRFAKLFSRPEIQPALKDFLNTLPTIFQKVGDAIVELTGGLINFFRPILPFAEKLATAFFNLSTQFAEWAGSAKGQNAIKDFMDKAWAAAKDLWDIIVLVGQALGGIISIATGEKDSKNNTTILDSIKTSLQGVVDFINSPEGAQAIQDFFTNARTTAAQLGDSIKEIAAALGTVNWKDASDKANGFLDALGHISSLLVIFGSDAPLNVRLFELAWATMGDTFRTVFNNFIYPAIKGIVDGLIAFLSGMGLLFHVLGRTIPGNDPFDQVAASIDGAIVKLAELSGNIQKIPDGFTTIHVGLIGPGAQLALSATRRAQSRNKAQAIQMASGGILTAPTFIRSNVLAGEAGREAVVPLDRPLHLVDRSVRALAAFAQGLPVSRMASGGVVGGGVTVAEGAIQVTVPNSNPILVAEAVLDRLAVGVRV